jgi:hypothetical protein
VSRTVGIAGFSIGGALALRVGADLDAGPSLPIWLLDTFAARSAGSGFWRKVERNIAWALFGGRPKAMPPESADPRTPPGVRTGADPAQWRLLASQLERVDCASPTTPVRLLQAGASVQRVGLLRNRRSNGFAPSRFGSLAVHRIDGEHLDLPRHLAAATAKIILAHEDFDAGNAD